jgi:hypothetical protein
MTDPRTAILKEIERRLHGMFADGVVIENITAKTEADALLAKAVSTSDPTLRQGYRELAEEAGA